MRTPTPLPEGAEERLKELLIQTQSLNDFKRIQSVWMRARLGLSAQEIAAAIGWSTSHVRRIHASYLKEGERVLLGKGRGGRYNQNLSVQEEEELLKPFFKKNGIERIIVREVKEAYEKKVGHLVPNSTIYRMLKRHGWSKKQPLTY